MGSISLLDHDHIEPGQYALGQLFLEEPVAAVWGQPFVLRDSSAEHTLGGGIVLQPAAAKIRRRHAESLERLQQLDSPDETTRTLATAWFTGFRGLNPQHLVRDAGIPPSRLESLCRQLITEGTLTELMLSGGRKSVLHSERVAELEGRLLETLGLLHAEQPLATTHDRQGVLTHLEYVEDEPLLQAVVDRLIETKRVVGDSRRIARADFKPKLSVNQRKLKDRIVEAHQAARFTPPEPNEFINLAGGNAASLRDIFDVATAEGLLVKITENLYLSVDAEAEMRRSVSERLREGPGATVAQIRDMLGTTRKFAVPLCEYLDRIGVTRRQGDLRVAPQ
jgi:selenocysteine-specific elongation factor